MRSLAFGIVLCAAVSGCAMPIAHGNKSATPNDKESIVAISFRMDDKCPGRFKNTFLEFEIITGNDTFKNGFQIQNAGLKSDFDDPPGFLYVMPIKTGEVRLGKISRVSSAESIIAARDINYFVRIEPDKVLYLGEVFVEVPADCSGFLVSVNDRRVRDGAVFDKRMKNVNSKMFVYRPPTPR
jgi:hypothetical protein